MNGECGALRRVRHRLALTQALIAMMVGLLGMVAAEALAGAASIRHVATIGHDVGDCTKNPCLTVGYAIGVSSGGDEIDVAAGTYTELVTADRSIAVVGAGIGSTVIDGAAAGTVVTIGSSKRSLDVRIADLSIVNGLAQRGGGVASLPGSGRTNSVEFDSVVISNNRAVGPAGNPGGDALGGGVYNGAGSTVSITMSSLVGNTATGGAGSNGFPGDPGGAGFGGAIANDGTLSIETSTIADGVARGGRGGDGLCHHFIGSSGGRGGDAAGGAILSTGTLSIDRSALWGDIANGGAGGRGGSGGLQCPHGGDGGSGGEAAGGAIDGAAQVSNSTVAADNALGGEAGAHGCGPLGCGREGKGGAGAGGGILARVHTTLVNDTVATNSAGGGHGRGGAARAEGGGIDMDSGAAVNVANTIFASNAAMNGPDCFGTVDSGGHNLIRDKSACSGFDGPGDLVGVGAGLKSLGNYGGTTFTLALKRTSPAIDAGDDAVCTTPPIDAIDQRGVPRPDGAHCDIGAFELQRSRP
jgi:hypothetical protein